ncbi:MAG TPA: hypothetical protein VMY42_03710 [Thermoguttaceae bacterium]|nr:hypothetical protein [Thermoguttaceae bacterium]
MAEKPVRRKLPWWKKLLFTTAVFLPVLLVIEAGMRICGEGPAIPVVPAEVDAQEPPTKPRELNAFEYFTICDAHLGFCNYPNGDFRSPYIVGNPVSTTDKFGYRNGYGWTAEGDSPIVLFVGDSITFASEVNDDQTGPSEVARLLAEEEFDVRVLNAGVRGFGTVQSKRMLAECFERFANIVAVVYTHCGNDLEENVVPNLRNPARAPVMLRDDATGEFREVDVAELAVPPGRNFLGWKPEPLPPRTPTALERAAVWIEEHSALGHFFLSGWRKIEEEFDLREYEFPSGKHFVPVSEYAKWNTWAGRHGGEEVLQRLVVEMDRICREHGAAFLTTTYADGSELEAAEMIARICAAVDVPFVDSKPAFRGPWRFYSALRTDGTYDPHYGPEGTKTYAVALAPALKQVLRSQGIASKQTAEP